MTRGSKIAIGFGGVAVAGLLVGLLVAMSAGSKSRDRAAAKRQPRDAGAEEPMSRLTGDVRPLGGGRPIARVPVGDTDVEDAVDGGAYLVRDHEPGEGPRRPSPITHVTVAQVRAEVQPLIRQCAAPLRQADPPVRERIHVTAMVSSAGGRVKVHDAVVKGAADTVSTDLVDCIKKVFDQVSFDAPAGQGEGETKLHLPFMLP